MYCNKKINKYVDSKLKALTQYKVLLPEQISKKLTNSTIDYDKSGVKLTSHNNILTTDYDEYSRKINSIYLNDILSKNTHLKKTFSSILEKAFINTVSYDSKLYEVISSSELESELYNKISFAYSRIMLKYFLLTRNMANFSIFLFRK